MEASLTPERRERKVTAKTDESSLPEPSPRRHVPEPQAKPPRLGRLAFYAVILFAAALVFGLIPRLRERRIVASDTVELSKPNVAVVSPAPAKAADPITLSGELKPVNEASIHARVNGYIRRWLVDLGAQVEAGQLLAELDTPDTDRELSQARAQVVQAEAARNLAFTTAKRWKEMLQAKTVSAQETDEKSGDYDLKSATVEAAKANVERLEQVASFAKITAPFPGTITVRRVNVGELITSGEGQELFRLAETDKLRVFVRVPQGYARGTTVGQTADLMLPEFPGRKFEAKVVRTAGALDAATRTLLTELEVDNAKGEILAGSYAQVRLTEATAEPPLTLPANTIMFRSEGPQVAVVKDGKVNLRQISLGRDFGSALEVRSGVTKEEKVVVNPGDTLTDGAIVHVVESEKKAEPEKK